jgi:RHS repeat-associated protein
VEFVYDAFGRRVRKRLLLRGVGGLSLQSETTFVWDRDTLCEELTRYADGRQTRRSYMFRGEDFAPVAHVDHGAPDGGLRVYANDPNGTPDALLDLSGRVVCELETTPWGRKLREGQQASTPIRRQGEYFDEETGLVYNRHRYSDPELGQFLCADPVGLEGGLNLYRSGPNSVGWVDPFGLSPESDRASEIRTNQGGVGWGTTYAVATLSNGDTVVVDSRGAVSPATRVRDPSSNNTRGTPGAAASGGVTDDEWLPRAGPDSNPGNIDNPHHAERRIIEHCRAVSPPPPAPPVTITSISATNNVCPTCRAAIRAHSPGAVITNPDGTAAPNP